MKVILVKEVTMLTAISPIDGRYRLKLEKIVDYFSEFALIKYRLKIEILYLMALGKIGVGRQLKAKEKKFLTSIWKKFNLEEAQKVKEIEKKINHDVKACEYFLRDKISQTSLKDLIPFIHFALTSEDVNNLAFTLTIKDFLDKAYWPAFEELITKLKELVRKYQNVVMLSHTHGQPASPTTLGKELAVFIYRLLKQKETFPKKLTGKLAGAVGNFNAHVIAYPQIDWLNFSKRFIKKLGLEPWLVVTQIEPYDRLSEIFQAIIRINNILLDFAKDIWLYIAFDYFKQKVIKEEVGSSTMPHKINPIDFENAEGNLGVANAFLTHFVEKLSISRLQRDLSDSTVKRNFGVAFGHSLLAYYAITKGLNKIEANKEKMKADLELQPQVVAEAIQTVLRREKIASAYEFLKNFTRGKKITRQSIQKFIDGLKVSTKVKKELKAVTPQNYLGLAKKLTKMVLEK